MRRRWLPWALGLVLMLAFASTALAAAAVPGATYSGAAADGASVKFTVSSDGTLVTSYFILGATGHEASGATCGFTGEGVDGQWSGAAILNGAFEYHFYDAILFQGRFTGSQSASGTFRFYDPATSQTPACDTGVVSWTAATSSRPSAGGGSGGSQGGGGGGHGIATRVTFRKASSKLLSGQIKSPMGACRAGRTVVLWRGNHRMGTTKSKAGGKFSFRRTASLRGAFVRASTPTHDVKAGACAAASSTFIKD